MKTPIKTNYMVKCVDNKGTDNTGKINPKVKKIILATTRKSGLPCQTQ